MGIEAVGGGRRRQSVERRAVHVRRGERAARRRVMAVGIDVGDHVGAADAHRHSRRERHLLPTRRRLAREGGLGEQRPRRAPQVPDVGAGVRRGLVEAHTRDVAGLVDAEGHPDVHRVRVSAVDGPRGRGRRAEHRAWARRCRGLRRGQVARPRRRPRTGAVGGAHREGVGRPVGQAAQGRRGGRRRTRHRGRALSGRTYVWGDRVARDAAAAAARWCGPGHGHRAHPRCRRDRSGGARRAAAASPAARGQAEDRVDPVVVALIGEGREGGRAPERE